MCCPPTQNPQSAGAELGAITSGTDSRMSPTSDLGYVLVTAASPERWNVSFNINFEEIAATAGSKIPFHPGSPLNAAAVCNRLLLSAARSGCDLYLSQPMSTLVGDKLYESARPTLGPQFIIQELKDSVAFPDVRKLVNNGDLEFEDVLHIRSKASRFRDWLTQQGERDRSAIIAYHTEVATASGFVTLDRKTLSLFGAIGGAAAVGALGSILAGPKGGAIAGALGATVGELAAMLGAAWKPIVFGEWMRDRIEELQVHRKQRPH